MRVTEPNAQPLVRRLLKVSGQVQGVGFRPFVWRLAQRHGVGGFIRNDNAGVTIEVQGAANQVAAFGRGLREERPALAVIDAIAVESLETLALDAGEFRIEQSVSDDAAAGRVTVDTAVCPACVREMLDPRDRRSGYGLINCTDCGPRYSIVKRVPYDRPSTTMASFPLCEKCHEEYENPADRRFHAQPVACRQCGPLVSLVELAGAPLEAMAVGFVNPPLDCARGLRQAEAGTVRRVEGDPIARAVGLLGAGKVLAIKGLGGFHLACRALDAEAVRRLRKLKHRDAKPFALMCASVVAAQELVELSDEAAALMQSPACPIVLAPRRADAGICDEVAPGNHRLGVMLPYTPIQHLLFARGGAALGPLVMTSANVSDEPLVKDNDEAVQRLGGRCDAILWHDRPIERCVDDSVVIDMGSGADPLPIRRARGYVPGTIQLKGSGFGVQGAAEAGTEARRHEGTKGNGEAEDAPPSPSPGTPGEGRGEGNPQSAILNPQSHPGLCVGGELKNTVAVVRGDEVVLSHHLGNLTHPLAFEYFKKAIDDLQQLFDVRPAWIAHDLHPVYLSTVYAREMAQKLGVPLVGVQHHHAHAAAVMAEHGERGPVLAVVCDGVGYGSDGTIWGGELLLADLLNFRRMGQLEPLRLPGGDAAAQDTRRCAMALLHQAYGNAFDQTEAARRVVPDATQRMVLAHMIRNNMNCAISSAAGRVFDGAAALLGLCERNHFEAQAAMRLESVAASCGVAQEDDREPGLFTVDKDTVLRISLAPLIRELAERAEPQAAAGLAALFHETLAAAWVAAVQIASQRSGVRTVALSGGVFCNERLTRSLTQRLETSGFCVLRHRVVPPNDGGLSLGQAAVATARMAVTAIA